MNTLTSPKSANGTPRRGLGTPSNNASVLDLAGFQSNIRGQPNAVGRRLLGPRLHRRRPVEPSRPGPGPVAAGGGHFYGPLPLATGTAGAIAPPTDSLLKPLVDPVLFPLPQAPPQQANTATNYFIGGPNQGATLTAATTNLTL